MAEQLFCAMLRVKNEERWLERCLDSLLPICQFIVVLDDHSTDRTKEIVLGTPQTVYTASPFEGLDEARDKNFLLAQIRERALRTAGNVRISHPWWVLNIDGDEELEPGGARRLHRLVAPEHRAYTLRVAYLWNRENIVRSDGVYKSFKRASLFRLEHTTPPFVATPWARGGLHCGNMPEALKPDAVELDVTLLHYGYMRREDRVRKYLFYNSVDPDNDNEDRYRHIIQGDGPAQGALEQGIEFPDARARLKWAGPLTLLGRT
jgi:glycosyltransferase involved in cell wall biosynthesis